MNSLAKRVGQSIVLLLILVFALQMSRSLTKLSSLRMIKTGSIAPLFERPMVSSSDNAGIVSLKSLRGKVVILDFFATWCVPCQKSMPILQAFAAKHPDELRVVSMSLDAPEEEKQALAMATKLLPSSILVMGDLTLEQDYGVTMIPHMVVIDKEGIIRRIYRGSHLGSFEQELEEVTKNLW